MIGQLLINGKDAFTTWGIILTDDAISAILTPPPLKEFITNSSRAEHGTRVVVGTPKVDSRELTVTFILTAPTKDEFFTKYLSFCEELKNGVLSMVISYQPEVVYNFVYRSCQQFSQYNAEAAKFLLKLTEFNPNERST